MLMFRNIINTLFTKFSSALLSFATVVLISRVLGSAGKGEQAIVVYNIYLLMLLFTLVGNSTLVYLAPRQHNGSLLRISLLWVFASAFVVFLPFVFMGSEAPIFIFESILIAVLAATGEINQFLLLGKEQVKQANLVKLLYPLISFGYLGVLHCFSALNSVSDCIVAMLAGYGMSAVCGCVYLKDDYKQIFARNNSNSQPLFSTLFKLGATKQLGSITQSLNYRLSFYVLGFYCGESMVGIYSNGVSIGEAVMLFGSSLALVQYSKLSNTENHSQSKRLTNRMCLINGGVTLLALLFFDFLPAEVYCFVFGDDFGRVRDVMRMLSIGILFLSISSNFTQYLFAKGNFKTTTLASLLGLAVTLIGCFGLVPRYGISGAAITACVSYCVSFLVEFVVYLRCQK